MKLKGSPQMQRQSIRFAICGHAFLVALSLVVGGVPAAYAQASAPEAISVVTLHIDPKPVTHISRDIYGVNYDWNKVTAEETPEWIKFMRSTADVNLMLFPGGWNPEHYDWANNTMPAWRNHLQNGFDPATDKPGADPKTFLSLAPEAAFVTPSTPVIDPSTLPQVVALSRDLVRQYGARVPRWDIGNEWWIQRGGLKFPAILSEDLSRYAALVAAVVPVMKAENPHISIFVNGDWEHPEEFAEIRKLVGPKVWSQIDGISVHPYCGVKPPCSAIPAMADAIRQASGKDRIFDSQWLIRMKDLPDDYGIKNANRLVLALSDIAHARIEAAILWPVTSYIPQLNFVSKDYQTAYASGILFGWMSSDYEGQLLNASGYVQAAVAKSGSELHIILPSMKAGPMSVRIPLDGLGVKKVAHAEVLYSDEPDDVHRGRLAMVSPLPAQIGSDHVLTFTLNPGTAGRGKGWEIARISLQ
jgi:hypothetical protein